MTNRQTTQSSFAVLLQHLARAWRREVDEALAPLGLSEAPGTALLTLSRVGGGIRQGALAERLGIEGPSLVPLLDQLCAAGLVTRCEDSQDRRAKVLHLTESGQALAVQLEAAMATVRTRLLGRVSDADMDAALRVFHALEGALGHSKLPPARSAS